MNYEFSHPVRFEVIEKKGYQKTLEPTTDEAAALAKRFDLLSLKNMKASISVTPLADGIKYKVTGAVSADIEQASVISGESFTSEINQDIEAWYQDRGKIALFEDAVKRKQDDEEHELRAEQDDPEIITNGILDIGEVAAQFLGLGIDVFPRAANEKEGTGDYIEIDPKETRDNPFAKLAELKTEK